MSILKKVSIYNAIGQAVDDGDELYIKNLPILLKWAKQSYSRILGKQSLPQIFIHGTVTENRCALNSGTIYVMMAYMGNIDLKPGYWANPEWMNSMGAITLGADNQLYILGGSNQLMISNLTWAVQDNDIVFDRNIDGQEVTLDTLGIELDVEGNPTIEENLVEPIGKFIQFKLAEKENSMKFRRSTLRPIDIAYAKSLYKDYGTLVAKSRPELTPSEKSQIAKMFNFPWTGNSLI